MIDLVIFGATGDLAARKLFPAIYELEAAGYLPEELRIVGVGRKPWSEHEFDKSVREALAEFQKNLEADVVERFIRRTTYRQMDFSPESFEALAKDSAPSSIFYLSLPPDAFPVVGTGLGEAGLAREKGNHFRRLVIEKPFGHDLQSALELQATLTKHWDESQILRIDHFLGKETVQNILVFRFANSWLEPLWNAQHIAQVQITAAESIGIEGRGAFYDKVGAVRDMMQNHMMQLLTLSALEPPPRLEADLLRNEKNKVLRSARPLSSGDIVRGQYTGYLEEAGVKSSNTETFAALRLYLDNWRWKGVPFYLRTGKSMSKKRTTIAVQFREPPTQLFTDTHCDPGSSWVVLELQPNESLHLEMQVKTPGLQFGSRPVVLSTPYSNGDAHELSAYATLILDALEGDASLFIRFDEVEWAWRLIEPVLGANQPVELYSVGSDGPAGQHYLMEDLHRWRSL
ncbi:glucose-6-phosphate dehydrogenase [Calidithermus roseus]|uniref:Glucose-6-phosphate 1-dehydrogenase n=1 Tax=Calidithermus roseus TaxID=1644118 RepID=A0A399F4K4_9DEIN|nr:glucose-6-phosphate dehydrogenase [Calidithermus roseus]RIH89792.1 Glucose-6-phosphate 1-dehydrogenase [Calidithermus roseus]